MDFKVFTALTKVTEDLLFLTRLGTLSLFSLIFLNSSLKYQRAQLCTQKQILKNPFMCEYFKHCHVFCWNHVRNGAEKEDIG